MFTSKPKSLSLTQFLKTTLLVHHLTKFQAIMIKFTYYNFQIYKGAQNPPENVYGK